MKILSTETNLASATNVSNAPVVRLFNSGASNILVTQKDYQGANEGTFMVMSGDVVYCEKYYTDTLEGSADVKATKTAYSSMMKFVGASVAGPTYTYSVSATNVDEGGSFTTTGTLLVDCANDITSHSFSQLHAASTCYNNEQTIRITYSGNTTRANYLIYQIKVNDGAYSVERTATLMGTSGTSPINLFGTYGDGDTVTINYAGIWLNNFSKIEFLPKQFFFCLKIISLSFPIDEKEKRGSKFL